MSAYLVAIVYRSLEHADAHAEGSKVLHKLVRADRGGHVHDPREEVSAPGKHILVQYSNGVAMR